MKPYDINIDFSSEEIHKTGVSLNVIVSMINEMSVRCIFNPYYRGVEQALFLFNIMGSVGVAIDVYENERSYNVHVHISDVFHYDDKYEMAVELLIESFIRARIAFDNKVHVIPDIDVFDVLQMKKSKYLLLTEPVSIN